MGLQHLVDEIECAEAGSLRPENRSAPFQTLAGDDAALELAGQPLVFAKEETYLTAAYADVAGGNIHVGADIVVQLLHERLAEAHHLGIAPSADGEVGTALGAAHRQRGERVLERLFKAEELHDAQRHRRVETQSALIGTDGAVELHAVTRVDLYVAVVVNPRHPEYDDALGLHQALNNLSFLKLRMLVVDILY